MSKKNKKTTKKLTDKQLSHLESVEILLQFAHPADYLETMTHSCFQLDKNAVHKMTLDHINQFFKQLVLSNEL